jgi:hypothetical protein
MTSNSSSVVWMCLVFALRINGQEHLQSGAQTVCGKNELGHGTGGAVRDFDMGLIVPIREPHIVCTGRPVLKVKRKLPATSSSQIPNSSPSACSCHSLALILRLPPVTCCSLLVGNMP